MSLIPHFTRGRRVTGTLNNPTAAERAHFSALCTDAGHDPRIKYLVFQSEVGVSLVHHIQYYCIFETSMRARQAHAVLGPNVHFDLSRGTPAQNTHYCQKPVAGCNCTHCIGARQLPNDGREVLPQFITGVWGEIRRPRSDKLSAVVEMMGTGATLREVLDAHPKQAIMYGSRIEKEFLRRLGRRDWAMDIDIFVGPTGSGKSSTAKLENPDYAAIPWPTGGRWWFGGYSGQACIILDDFRSGNITVLMMMKLLDRHAWTIEAKGCNMEFVSRKIVITTNVDPRDWYQLSKLVDTRGEAARRDVLDPLARRISEYATIWDFAPGHAYPHFVKVARPKPVRRWFVFRDSVVHDFGRDEDDSEDDGSRYNRR